MANSVDDKDDEYFRSYTDLEVNKQIINWNSNWGKASGVFFDLFIREETPILFAALLRGDCSLAIIIFLFFCVSMEKQKSTHHFWAIDSITRFHILFYQLLFLNGFLIFVVSKQNCLSNFKDIRGDRLEFAFNSSRPYHILSFSFYLFFVQPYAAWCEPFDSFCYSKLEFVAM